MTIDSERMQALKQRVAARISGLTPNERLTALRKVPPLMDLTDLSSSATPEKIRALCANAKEQGTAGVCVHPWHVRTARTALDNGNGAGSRIRVASVAGNFPFSQTDTDIKAMEVRRVVEMGAGEVDVVLNQGAFLSGDLGFVRAETRALREAANGAMLKVILETCSW